MAHEHRMEDRARQRISRPERPGGSQSFIRLSGGQTPIKKEAFRLGFASTISDGPRTARCLLPAREGPRLRRHRTS
jgi:hypothetical protein